MKTEFNFPLNNLILSLIAGLSVKNYSEVEKEENEQCIYKTLPIGVIGFVKPNYILQELKKIKDVDCQNATMNDIETLMKKSSIHNLFYNPDNSLQGVSFDSDIIREIIYNQQLHHLNQK